MSGTIVVKNLGNGHAGASQLVIVCKKAGYAAGTGCNQGSFGSSGPWLQAGQIYVNVPPLAAGASYTHALNFWATYKWDSGSYYFTAEINPSSFYSPKPIKESDKTNNIVTSSMSVP